MLQGHVLQGQEEAQQHCFAVPENMSWIGAMEAYGRVLNAAQLHVHTPASASAILLQQLHVQQVARMNTGVSMQSQNCAK
jgi:hypothetical protein